MIDDEKVQESDIIQAVFRPKQLATLRPESQALIGQTLTFRASWRISCDDDNQYVGQWAWHLLRDLQDKYRYYYWCPSEDLEEI